MIKRKFQSSIHRWKVVNFVQSQIKPHLPLKKSRCTCLSTVIESGLSIVYEKFMTYKSEVYIDDLVSIFFIVRWVYTSWCDLNTGIAWLFFMICTFRGIPAPRWDFILYSLSSEWRMQLKKKMKIIEYTVISPTVWNQEYGIKNVRTWLRKLKVLWYGIQSTSCCWIK